MKFSACRSLLKLFALMSLLTGVATAAQPGCGPYDVTLYEYGSLYYKGEAGNYVGIDLDVVNEVARRTGCVFKPSLDSRSRTWARMADGSLDMTVSGLETAERNAFARFVPYISSRNYLVVRNELAERVKSLHAFAADKQLRLGVVRGFRHGETIDPWIDTLRAQQRVDEYADAEALARVFARGRDDAFFAEPLAWRQLLGQNGLDGKVRKLNVAPQDAAIGGLVLSRKRVKEADLELMRRTIAGMRVDGTLEAIFSRYLDAETAREMARAP